MERKNLNRLAVAAGLALLASLPQSARAQDCEAPIDLSAWNGEDLHELAGGYCQSDFFVPGLITYETWMRPAPTHIEGNAVWYNPGVMQEVAGNKGIVLSTMDPSSPILDGVALMSPADVGKTVWVHRNGIWEGPYLAIDTTNRQHMTRSVAHVEEAMEISFETADRWGMIGRTADGSIDRSATSYITNVRVCIADNPSVCDGTPPVDYPSWWRNTARFVNPNGGASLTYAEVRSLPESAGSEQATPHHIGTEIKKGINTITSH